MQILVHLFRLGRTGARHEVIMLKGKGSGSFVCFEDLRQFRKGLYCGANRASTLMMITCLSD